MSAISQSSFNSVTNLFHNLREIIYQAKAVTMEQTIVPSLLNGSHYPYLKIINNALDERQQEKDMKIFTVSKELPLELQKKLAKQILESLDRIYYQPVLKIKVEELKGLSLRHLIDFTRLTLLIEVENKVTHQPLSTIACIDALVERKSSTTNGVVLEQAFTKLIDGSNLSEEEKTNYKTVVNKTLSLSKLTQLQEEPFSLLITEEQENHLSNRKVLLHHVNRLIPQISKMVKPLLEFSAQRSVECTSKLQGFFIREFKVKDRTSKFFKKVHAIVSKSLYDEQHIMKSSTHLSQSEKQIVSNEDYLMRVDNLLKDLEFFQCGRDVKLSVFLQKLVLYQQWLANNNFISYSLGPRNKARLVGEKLISSYFLRQFAQSIKECQSDETTTYSLAQLNQIASEFMTSVADYIDLAKDGPPQKMYRTKLLEKASPLLKPFLLKTIDIIVKMHSEYIQCRIRWDDYLWSDAGIIVELDIDKKKQRPSFYPDILGYFRNVDVGIDQLEEGQSKHGMQLPITLLSDHIGIIFDNVANASALEFYDENGTNKFMESYARGRQNFTIEHEGIEKWEQVKKEEEIAVKLLTDIHQSI